MFKRYLMHDRLRVRFGALFGMVLIVLLGSWALSYLLLPEGVLRARTVGIVLAITMLLIVCGWEAYRFAQAIASRT